MGQTTVNLSMTKAGYVREDAPTTVYPINGNTDYYIYTLSPEQLMYLGFASLDNSLKYRRLYSMRLKIQAKKAYYSRVEFVPIDSDFTAGSITYENAPDAAPNAIARGATLSKTLSDSYSDVWVEWSLTPPDYVKSNAVRYAILYGLRTDVVSGAYLKTVLNGGGSPYIEVTLDDSTNVLSQIEVRSGPTSGYLNPRNAKTFTWAFKRKSSETYYCVGDFTQASAALKWSVSGSGIWNTVTASGSDMNVTVPANTFPTASTIEWYLTGTDNIGTTSGTEHYTFSTSAGTASATPVSPINSVEDGSKAIKLVWELSSTDGQEPSYVDLQWKKPSDLSWTDLLSHSAAVSYYDVTAGTFSAGEVTWRVRAYNVDDTAGSWSDVINFVCVAAPAAPSGLQATEVPRTLISWQATGQEAFEIEIDGKSVAKTYSPSASSWQLDEPLEDGTHIIRVRIQGVYGLWSDWASVTIDVLNVPATTATLTGEFGIDANLSLAITTVPDPLVVQWYRDGVRIGRTSGISVFLDRMVLGNHSWYAELWYSNGYYVRSNIVTGMLKSCETRISLIDYGSAWLTLELSEHSDSVQSFNWSKASSLRHIRGAVYPVLELGEDEDYAGSYDCAFKSVEDARKLEALKGKIVIIKSRGREVVIGALTRLSKRMKDFYIAYTFSVQQIHREDFVNYDANS